ncbi:hypothetical protein EV182_001352, partial [Spiromyces aspiralis]
SPDGQYLITNSNDNAIRLFALPAADMHHNLEPFLTIPSGETVLDLAWYPFMSSSDPQTCCFLASTRDHPIHLRDVFTGKSRAAYRAFNDKEELISATSVAFNPRNTQFCAGYWERVMIFDTNRPGEPLDTVLTSPKRKSRDGQKGIISCIAFASTAYHCSDGGSFGAQGWLPSGVYATGSFGGTVALWSDTEQQGGPVVVTRIPSAAGGHAGVTKVKFSPDGRYLFVASRRSRNIACYDPRDMAQPVALYSRPSNTQQRLGFDIDPSQQWLIAGEQNGDVSFYTLTEWPDPKDPKPQFRIPMHRDVVSDVAVHPTMPVLATVSGQRKFHIHGIDDGLGTAGSDGPDTESMDNSLRLWYDAHTPQ